MIRVIWFAFFLFLGPATLHAQDQADQTAESSTVDDSDQEAASPPSAAQKQATPGAESGDPDTAEASRAGEDESPYSVISPELGASPPAADATAQPESAQSPKDEAAIVTPPDGEAPVELERPYEPSADMDETPPDDGASIDADSEPSAESR